MLHTPRLRVQNNYARLVRLNISSKCMIHLVKQEISTQIIFIRTFKKERKEKTQQ
jgi:hypothetical protein